MPPDPYLGGEHVQNAIDGPSQQQPPDQEAGEHHVGEEGAEVHHLQRGQGPTVGQRAPCGQHRLPAHSWGIPLPAHSQSTRASSDSSRKKSPGTPGHRAKTTTHLALSQGRSKSTDKLESAWLCLGLASPFRELAGPGLQPPHPQGPPRGRGSLSSPLLTFSCLMPALPSLTPVDPLRLSPVLRAPLMEGIREVTGMAPKPKHQRRSCLL